MPPTVLHVAQPTVAGVAVVVRALARDQVRRGWRVLVACPPEGDLATWVRSEGAEHLAWSATRSPWRGIRNQVAQLRAITKRVRPDLVHLHSSKAGLAGRLAVRGTVPSVFQPHGWSFLAVSGSTRSAAVAWERFAIRWTDALAHVSAGERDTGERAGIRAPWVHTPNGVDLTVFRPSSRGAARAALHLKDGPLLLCLGRISYEKGQDWLLSAWPRVLAAVPSAALVLAGVPDPADPKLSDAPSVTAVGPLSDPSGWMVAADVVALPSRWEAGLPLVAREAMACGRSVVMSDVPGAREDLPDGAGAIVSIDDVEGLAAALVMRLRDRRLADREGAVGRAHAAEHFDVAVTSERVAQLYAELAPAFRPTGRAEP